MNDYIEKLLSKIKKERILVLKIVESEEKQDRDFFNYGTCLFNDIATETDVLIKELVNNYSYESIINTIIEEYSSNDELNYDSLTLLGLINTTIMNEISNEFYNEDSDLFTSIIVSNLYNTYLWAIRSNNYQKEVIKEMRYDIVNTLVISMAMREYFKGNFNVFDNIDYGSKEDKIEKMYFNILNSKVVASNTLEMFDGFSSENEFFARKEMMKLEFVSLSYLMMKENIRFPILAADISDFTENIIVDASSVLEKFKKNEKIKEKVIKL